MHLTEAMFYRMISDFENGRRSDLWEQYQKLTIMGKHTLIDNLKDQSKIKILHYIANKQIGD